MEGNRIHQLKDLFQFANLPFSLDDDALIELKKVLFLMIKSAGDDQRLEINGIHYTRNDIVSILEEGITEEETTLFNFFEHYPGVAPILHPSRIVEPMDFGAFARMQGETWDELRFELNEDYFMPFLAETYKTVSKLDIDRLYYLLTYVQVFMGYYQEQFYRKIIPALINRFEGLRMPDTIDFIHTESYRRVLEHFSTNGHPIALKLFHAMLPFIEHLAYLEGVDFFERQSELIVFPNANRVVQDEYDSFLRRWKITSISNVRSGIEVSGKAKQREYPDTAEAYFERLRQKILKYIGIFFILFFAAALVTNIVHMIINPEEPEEDPLYYDIQYVEPDTNFIQDSSQTNNDDAYSIELN